MVTSKFDSINRHKIHINADCLMLCKVSNCGMSEAIGPVHIKERSSSEMQSRVDAEVCFLNP
jgi:hypothetical protein